MTMKIMYVHGFGSLFDPESEKIQTLSKLGEVNGISVDWSKPETALLDLMEFAQSYEPDLVVGTSMGGWGASYVAPTVAAPFVAINPAIDPANTLRKYLGEGIDHIGRRYTLVEEDIATLPTLNEKGCAMILLDMADQVIDPNVTLNKYSKVYDVRTFEGGSHRFEHMQESLELIELLLHYSEITYGADV